MKNIILALLLASASFGLSFLEVKGKESILPDLIILNVENKCELPGMIVEVKNQGSFTAQPCKLFVKSRSPGAEFCLQGPAQYFTIPLLRAGQSTKIQVPLSLLVAAHCRCARPNFQTGMSFSFTADFERQVNEQDETNNDFPGGTNTHEYLNF